MSEDSRRCEVLLACRAGAALRGARKQEAKPFSKPLVCPVRSWEGQGALGLLQLLVLKGESALPWEHQATSFLTGEFQAGSDAISWRQAGLVGPPGSDSGDKHLSAHSSLSQCPPAPGLPCASAAFFGCLPRPAAEAAFGCLGAGGRHSWLRICTYITGVTSLSTLCTSRLL